MPSIQSIIDVLSNNTRCTVKDLDNVPHKPGVYACWKKKSKHCFYIGKATSAKTGGLDNRLKSHFRGNRGSDQFCLYVYDSHLKNVTRDGYGASLSKRLNHATREWIRDNVEYTYQPLDENMLSSIEKKLRLAMKPSLNPLREDA